MTHPVFRDHPSPNHDSRGGAAIDMLILHYTGMSSGAAALARLCDPEAKVSAHYLIEEDGAVLRLVPEAARAWHAGVAFWAGARDINARSIGIELVNPGHDGGLPDFPEAQMHALEHLARAILARHPIPPDRVLGHSDVAPERKQDPGERFDWARLARAGIGLWPEDPSIESPMSQWPVPDLAAAQRDLARFGYDAAPSGLPDARTACIVTAFQRHFRPARVDGVLDAETHARLRALLKFRDAALDRRPSLAL